MIDLGPLNFLHEHDVFWALVIVLSSLITSKLVNFLLGKIVHHFTKKTKTTLDDELLNAVKRPIFLGILLVGVFLAAASIHYLDPFSNIVKRTAVIIGTILFFYVVVRIINGLFNWYGSEIAARTRTDADDLYIPMFKRVVNIVLYVIAGMILLKSFGVEITPLVAGLGIGGLAVALALQDTLANFFAGFYIVSDKSVKVGDYIELESGLKGYVDDISWRTTRIRTLPGNYVIIPNSKLAQSVTTNYYFAKPEMSVVIPVGVAYDSDLEKVEKATIKVATQIQKTVEGAIKDFEPFIRYGEFGDSNINFSAILRVEKFVDQYKLKHEFIKRLKKEYDKQKIEISFPCRNLYMRK